MQSFRSFWLQNQVQRQRQVFLSCYLVAIPFHLETVDKYAHNGVFMDNSFRAPWDSSPDGKGSAFAFKVVFIHVR